MWDTRRCNVQVNIGTYRPMLTEVHTCTWLSQCFQLQTYGVSRENPLVFACRSNTRLTRSSWGSNQAREREWREMIRAQLQRDNTENERRKRKGIEKCGRGKQVGTSPTLVMHYILQTHTHNYYNSIWHGQLDYKNTHTYKDTPRSNCTRRADTQCYLWLLTVAATTTTTHYYYY